MELVFRNQSLLHQVLDVLHQNPGALQFFNAVNDGVDAVLTEAVLLWDLVVGLLNGGTDLAAVVIDDRTVALDDFHLGAPLLLRSGRVRAAL